MGQIDFGRIRGDLPNGQRGAFEELVCQLARREISSTGAFRRIEGSGGDGGVECLHYFKRGRVGYQAKFYTNAGEIDWAAIDRSVRTALSLHPALICYVIALPCDFTGRRRSRGDTVSEGTWGIWDQHLQGGKRKPRRRAAWSSLFRGRRLNFPAHASQRRRPESILVRRSRVVGPVVPAARRGGDRVARRALQPSGPRRRSTSKHVRRPSQAPARHCDNRRAILRCPPSQTASVLRPG